MCKFVLTLGAALYLFFTGGAAACQSTSFVLDDNFKTPDSGWRKADTYVKYGPLGASVTINSDERYLDINRTYTSENSDICETSAWPAEVDKVKNKSNVSAAVVFWAKNEHNYYVALVDATGAFLIARNVAGNFSTLFTKSGKDLNLARLAASDKNEIEIQIAGSHATILLNSKLVTEINGQPPSGSGYIGFYASVSNPPVPAVISRYQIATSP